MSALEGWHCSVVSMEDLGSELSQGGLGTQWECFDGLMGLEGEWVEGWVSYGRIEEASRGRSSTGLEGMGLGL